MKLSSYVLAGVFIFAVPVFVFAQPKGYKYATNGTGTYLVKDEQASSGSELVYPKGGYHRRNGGEEDSAYSKTKQDFVPKKVTPKATVSVPTDKNVQQKSKKVKGKSTSGKKAKKGGKKGTQTESKKGQKTTNTAMSEEVLKKLREKVAGEAYKGVPHDEDER